MEELLLIKPSTAKGDASQKDASPFMTISKKEWKRISDENLEKSVNAQELGYIPTFEEVFQNVMESVEAHPYHRPTNFWSEVPREEGKTLGSTIQQEVWFVPLMFILFFGFGMVLTSRLGYIIQAIREFFYPKGRSDVFSDHITDEFGFKSAMTALSFSTITIFSQLALTQLFHVGGYEGGTACLRIFAIYFIYVAFKIVATLYLCTIFFDKSTFSVVRHSYATIVFALCTTLFPITLIASFTEVHIARYALIAGCVVCAIAVLLYLYKILSIFFNGLTSIFYLILYLCTLEILPTIALAGLLLG